MPKKEPSKKNLALFSKNIDPIKFELIRNSLFFLVNEMALSLVRSSYSGILRDNMDFSTGIADRSGEMVAQGLSLPLQFGPMPDAIAAVCKRWGKNMNKGDVFILNDPFEGGTHLPDITLITPIFHAGKLFALAANRAHHSDIGGMSPGSMPVSTEIFQEGMIIPPIKLVAQGHTNEAVLELLLANVRTPKERAGDIRAQIAANLRGVDRIAELVARYGPNHLTTAMKNLMEYSDRTMRQLISSLPNGTYSFSDVMDDDGVNVDEVKIQVCITINGDKVQVNFSGTSPQVAGSINATRAITLAATMYVFRSLLEDDIPTNSGCLLPIDVITPEGTVVNARMPAAVAGGNVETSQRITDVLLGALSQVCPDKVPAASQGTMNNLTIGGLDLRIPNQTPFAYYETIGGGMGACPTNDGDDAIHTHMTNTLNTPVEALEYAYPLRIRRYEVRRGSGGAGVYRGGDGIIREIEVLTEAQVTILSDRRIFAPYGLCGGNSGMLGRNYLIRDGVETVLAGKTSINVRYGDIISIHTPGGGGFGVPPTT